MYKFTYLLATFAAQRSEITKPLLGEEEVRVDANFVRFVASTSLTVFESTCKNGATLGKLRVESIAAKRAVLAIFFVKSNTSIIPENCPQSIMISFISEMKIWAMMGANVRTPQIVLYASFRIIKLFAEDFVFGDRESSFSIWN